MSNADKTLTPIVMCIVGHVDAGKSSLTGRLMRYSGQTSERELAALEKQAAENNKEGFAFAYISDTSSTERKRGVTIENHTFEFSTPNRYFMLVDCPGHKDYIKNMFNGVSSCDVAVVLAPCLGFQTALGPNGQTREHAYIVNFLGIKQIIMVITKMDTADYDEEKFTQAKNEMIFQLGKFPAFKNAPVLPVSALDGENGVNCVPGAPMDKMAWYKGPCLIEALDSLPLPVRQDDAPWICAVNGTSTVKGIGLILHGSVIRGTLARSVPFTAQPGNLVGKVDSIQRFHVDIQDARTGYQVGFSVKVDKKKFANFKYATGMVFADPAVDLKPSTHCFALCRFISLTAPKRVGYSPVMDIGFAHRTAQIVKVDYVKGTTKGAENTYFKESDVVEMEAKKTYGCFMTLNKPTVLTVASVSTVLSKFVMRDAARVIGFGQIDRVAIPDAEAPKLVKQKKKKDSE